MNKYIFYVTTDLPKNYEIIDLYIERSNNKYKLSPSKSIDFSKKYNKERLKTTLLLPMMTSHDINHFREMSEIDHIFNTFINRFLYEKLPKIFDIDRNFSEDSNFIKATIDESSIDTLFNFIISILEDYAEIQKNTFKNNDFHNLFDSSNELNTDRTIINDLYYSYIQPSNENLIGLYDNSDHSNEFNYYNLREFHERLILNYKQRHIDTYYFCITRRGEF